MDELYKKRREIRNIEANKRREMIAREAMQVLNEQDPLFRRGLEEKARVLYTFIQTNPFLISFLDFPRVKPSLFTPPFVIEIPLCKRPQTRNQLDNIHSLVGHIASDNNLVALALYNCDGDTVPYEHLDPAEKREFYHYLTKYHLSYLK